MNKENKEKEETKSENPKVVKMNTPEDENLELTQETAAEEMSMEAAASDGGGKRKNSKTGWIAGAAGAGGYALGLLTPIVFFPHDDKNDEEPENEEPGANSEEPKGEPAPELLQELTPHEMEVATGVEDEMSFSQAFATARQEVGPGGLFVWRGHTYGTYYVNEWNAMGAEERDQYWTDVYYTTSHIEYDPEPNPTQIDLEHDDPMAMEIDDDIEKEQIEKEQIDTDDEALPLVLDENDIYAVVDIDSDGQPDGLVADVDGSDALDLVVDSTGDGNADTLILNPSVDEEGNVSVDEDKVYDIDGVIILRDESGNTENVTDNTENDDLLLVQNDPAIADEQLSADDLV